MEQLLKKLRTLKKFISDNYNYVYTKETTNDFVKELMTALKGKHFFFCIVSTDYIN